MDIPYTVAVRRDTGLTNGKIGVWLFLASEVMLFGALFASYILIRTGSPNWPRGDTVLDYRLATFNTIVLITSSVTMVMAWASLMRRKFATFRIYMMNFGHHDGMLLVYFPKEKVLLEADGYNPQAASATPPTPRSPYTVSLYDNIQRLKLNVERIVPVHYPADNRQITMEELARWSGRSSSSQ